ncbi:MAG TPA: hypothetical protein PLI69_03975 [Bacteroidales bacterium]|nr:hypothetical protein [Bacteroidales bacterium]
MKRDFTIITLLTGVLLLLSAPLFAQRVERVWFSTDRNIYIAGERIWCSALCMDAATRTPSELSSIAYMELHSASGVAQTAKVALMEGRGAGYIDLPNTLPTGNYRLIAYTSANLNERGYDFEAAFSREISIFNVLSTARSGDVKVVGESDYIAAVAAAPSIKPCADVQIIVASEAGRLNQIPVSIVNNTGEEITFSLSIFNEDGLLVGKALGPEEFLKMLPDADRVIFDRNRTPEYEGEIITAQSGEKSAYISAIGNYSDIYIAETADDGTVRFFTGNIYGDVELVGNISSIRQPFAEPNLNAPSTLLISESLRDRLEFRGTAMQIDRRFDSDTLYELLPKRENTLLGAERITYILDDYTRFPLMEEVIVEYISQIRARKKADGTRDIQVKIEDVFRVGEFAEDASLMMVDGVPIFDHEMIYRYDPMLVKSIDIYPYAYFIGNRQFDGIVNMKTYKGTIPSLTLGPEVRIIEFQGAAVPMAYTCRKLAENADYPDYRQTLYWHPLLTAGATGRADSSVTVICNTPDYSGTFSIVVEGITSSGNPIFVNKAFKVQ